MRRNRILASLAAVAAGSASMLLLAAPASAYPPGSSRAACSASVYAHGQSATCDAGGFTDGEEVDGDVHSSPEFVGSTTASANGVATLTFTVPKDLPVGHHTLDLIGQTSGHVAAVGFTVNAKVISGAGGGGVGSSSNGSTLPFTGANAIWQMTAAGLALVLVGGTAVVVVRRRRGSGLVA